MKTPLIIGHRGASAVAPENTLAAFRRALSDGADGIEFDVRLARDAVPVVFHDASLRRIASRREKVALLSSSELEQVDVGSWFNRLPPRLAKSEYTNERVPTLEAVLDIAVGCKIILYVELKCDSAQVEALVSSTVKSIRRKKLADHVVIESFALEAIKEVKRIAPDMRTAALFDRSARRPAPSKQKMIEQAKHAGADELALHYPLANPKFLKAAKESGLATVVWTVDDVRWIERARSSNVKALITNNPALLLAARDATFRG